MSNTLTVSRGAGGTSTMRVEYKVDTVNNQYARQTDEILVAPFPTNFPNPILADQGSIVTTYKDSLTIAMNAKLWIYQKNSDGTFVSQANVSYDISITGEVSNLKKGGTNASQVVIDGNTVQVPPDFS